MTREEAIDILKHDISLDKQGIEYGHNELGIEALEMAIKALEQEPRKITYEDVKGYCKPRCLTIIDNELLYELTHPKIKALEQEPKILDKINTEIIEERKGYPPSADEYKTINKVLRIIDKYRKGE